MNVKRIASLSLFGVAVGVAGVLGWLGSFGLLVWLVFMVVAAVVIGRGGGGRHFLHGFLVGLVAWLIAIVLQVAFFETYLGNNPQAAISFAQLPTSMEPQLVCLVVGSILGLVIGALLGGMAALAGKFLGAGRPSATPTA